ncbi:MAG: nitrogenase [Clostridiales bacterium]|nr:nitrogenase [Clostridiales bacterium]MDR2749732.1 nitrogenase [Clostridiales bacterium]
MTTINLKAAELASRERRLGSITGFSGTAEELVTQSRTCELKDKPRAFSQCLGCSTSNAACTTILIQDAATISHGPIGCASCLHDFAFTYRVDAQRRGLTNVGQRKIYSTNLTERDTIYGGAEKLEEAIREVYQRAKPSAIFIITTCASGIIGDDVEGVAQAMQKELEIPVAAVFCEGFRSKMWTTGFDAGYHGIARSVIKKPQRKRDIINVINFWGTDIFSEWFAPFGMKPNYITPYSTIESLSQASEARATVQACSTLGSYLGAVLEQEFGVPEIKTSPPYGMPQTDRWFAALGELLGQPETAAQVLAESKRKNLGKIAELKEQLSGKTAYVTAGASHGHSLLAVLRELGMIPLGAAIFHHDPLYDNGSEDADTLQHVVRDYGDVPNYNVCNKQEFELVNALNRVKPDILLARHGGMTRWGAKLGIPTLLIGDEHFGMGYDGLAKYGETILETIENDEFVTNLCKHAMNPYSKWWLEQKPNAFLEGGSCYARRN